MDWNRIEGNWKQLKGKIKKQWSKLTDDDLDKIAGKRDQLEGKDPRAVRPWQGPGRRMSTIRTMRGRGALNH
jgi:uncharacterized protein YjbJ (UPF0337 family)